MHKAERTGRIAREPDGQWDIAKTRARLLETILQQHINELLTEASDRFDPPGIGGEREPHA
jgi:hypothetical protein